MKIKNWKLKIVFTVLVFGVVFFFGASITHAPLQHAQAADNTDIQIPPVRTPTFTIPSCDTLTDPNCPGAESFNLLTPEQKNLLQDTKNAEQAKQTQSTIALAANTPTPKSFCESYLDISCYLIQLLDWGSSALLRIPLVMVAGFLDQAVTLALTLPMDKIGFVVQGWKIIRDVSNMFYVLILLWVALGTIFDFPKYNVREILPKLVISALLINFSLPLGTLVINTTNALANVFYQGIVDAGTGINGEGKGRLLADKILENSDLVVLVNSSVRANLAQKDENIQQTIKTDAKKLETTQITDQSGQTTTVDCSKIDGDKIITDVVAQRNAQYAISPIDKTIIAGGAAEGCRDAVMNYLNGVEKVQDPTLLPFARLTAIIWKLILIPVLIFVLFAAALFIFIRTITLAFLLIFGPFVFLAWALPETRQYWTQWWDKLLKWSFFMPVLMFMLFLSVTMMTTFTPHMGLTAGTQGVLGETKNEPTLFVANMHFLFMLMLLIGSLTVAENMGIEMAARVRGLGEKALGRIKRTAKAPVYAGARIAKLNMQEMLGKGAGAITSSEQFQRIANMPIFTKTGIGGYAARTIEERRRAGEAAAVTRLKEKYGGDVTKMRPEQQAALFATGAFGEITGFYKKLDFEDQQTLWKTMNARQKDATREKLIKGGISATEIDQAQGNANAVAEAIRPNLRNLKTADPQKYNEEVINTLRSANYNFKNANPEFIKSDAGQELLKTMTANEMQQIIVTKEGFKALREVIQKQNLPNLGARIGVSPALNQFLNTGVGKALMRGINMQPDQPPNITKMIKNLQAQVQNIQGGGGQKTTPPPSEHIPGAT